MLMCASLWSIAGIFIKLIPWNSFAISGFRSLFAGLTILVYIAIKRYKIIINRKTLVAGLMMGLVYTAFVGANKLTTAANAIVLQFTAPLFVVVFSAIFYKQKIKRNDLIAVLFTLAGISMFFLDKLEGGYIAGNFVAIFAGACLAGMFITVGDLQGEERFSSLQQNLSLPDFPCCIFSFSAYSSSAFRIYSTAEPQSTARRLRAAF